MINKDKQLIIKKLHTNTSVVPFLFSSIFVLIYILNPANPINH
jgi:hypothetical protein